MIGPTHEKADMILAVTKELVADLGRLQSTTRLLNPLWYHVNEEGFSLFKLSAEARALSDEALTALACMGLAFLVLANRSSSTAINDLIAPDRHHANGTRRAPDDL